MNIVITHKHNSQRDYKTISKANHMAKYFFVDVVKVDLFYMLVKIKTVISDPTNALLVKYYYHNKKISMSTIIFTRILFIIIYFNAQCVHNC